MCLRTVEAPGACARGSSVEKSRTVPGAVLQREQSHHNNAKTPHELAQTT
jgi:hypothetical protein